MGCVFFLVCIIVLANILNRGDKFMIHDLVYLILGCSIAFVVIATLVIYVEERMWGHDD